MSACACVIVCIHVFIKVECTHAQRLEEGVRCSLTLSAYSFVLVSLLLLRLIFCWLGWKLASPRNPTSLALITGITGVHGMRGLLNEC